LDWQALLEALAAGGFLAGEPEDQDAVLAEERDAAANGRMGAPLPPGQLGALAVEHMPPGPAQAGWLNAAAATATALNEHELAGVVMASRRLASWAQAAELAAVAQITARAAAADPKIGVARDGRPARLCRDALAQISLALMLAGPSAGSWADLGVTLTWRLPDTGAALAAGRIDVDRATVIAEATAVLSEEAARAVEAKVLPGAGRRTRVQLQRRVRTAVIAADPGGAERRRQVAERHAEVRLYADDDQTASLVADKMPQVQTAAGYARIVALARARKAAGLPGSLGEHKAAVLLGLILGTLPWIPPADGAPPDQPPPPDDSNGPDGNGNEGPDGGPANGNDAPANGNGGPDGGNDNCGPDRGPSGPRPDDSLAGLGEPRSPAGHDAPGGPADHGGDRPQDDGPAPRDEDAPEDDGLDDQQPDDDGLDEDSLEDLTGPAPQWPELGTMPPPPPPPPAGPRAGDQPAEDRPPAGEHAESGDAQGGEAQGGEAQGGEAQGAGARAGEAEQGGAEGRTAGEGDAEERRPDDGWPGLGLLEISLPWTVLAGLSDEPGTLGRIGPITAVQARHLAEAAAHDPAAQWRIIITSTAGQAIAVTRIRRRTRDGPAPPQHHRTRQRPPPQTGLAGRITLTITQDTLASFTRTGPPGATSTSTPAGTGTGAAAATTTGPTTTGPVGEITAAALRAAVTALDQAAEDAAAGGCAHGSESKAYRPPPRLRDYIALRDLTCRFPTCGMPAWRGDLDHTIPWDQGGRTCRCNLGGGCRCHHQLKQHPRWRLEQTRPGEFTWITPAGRRYTVGPDTHLA
jgi:hypothetical protein